MFDADRPIVNKEQDRLDRNVFATYLARCMLDHQSPESLVIGLYGGWGSGKTSLINLALAELRSAANNMFDNEKPIILNFSPWSYSGQGQLIYGFFRRLSSELRQCPFLENAAEIIQLLELYVSFFTSHPVPKSLRLKSRFLGRTYAWESGQDPIQVKAALNNLLQNQKHKLIIIIDNISRLPANEINQIFQIVKSMGDYANTIYLLSLDKHQVLTAINQLHPGEGNDYLEKLVQLPFEVPPIPKEDLEILLFDRLLSITKEAPIGSWNTDDWTDVYYAALKYFFHSARDVTRFTNRLSFSFPRVKEVVNPVDFVALTALEVFEPAIFYGIAENKDLFTDLLENVYVLDQRNLGSDKARCEEILQRSSHISHDVLQTLLMLLFPRIRALYEPTETVYHSVSEARQHRRVCSPDIFDVYFRLSIPIGSMKQSEMDTLLALAPDQKAFTQALLELNQDNRIIKFLDLLEGATQKKIPPTEATHVINALMDSADLFPEGQATLLSFNTAMRVHRLCHQLLSRFKSPEERFALLKDAINNATKSLYIIVNELSWQSLEHLETDEHYLPLEHRMVTLDQLYLLQECAVKKIEYWATNGRLAEHPKLLPILKAWKAWGDNACSRFVTEMIQDEKGLLAFLQAALAEPIQEAITQHEKRPEWKASIDNITYFLPTDTIEPLARAAFEADSFEKLREEEQLSLLIFLDLIGAQTLKTIPKTTV